jgi:hypothetical protein
MVKTLIQKRAHQNSQKQKQAKTAKGKIAGERKFFLSCQLKAPFTKRGIHLERHCARPVRHACIILIAHPDA